jgi:hypothetical protein
VDYPHGEKSSAHFGCVVIGEDNAYVSVIVPPSQLRSFEGSVFFSDKPKPNKATWSYQIIETTAE